MELPYWKYKAVFVTLTYDDEHNKPSLEPQDLTRFLKRLRKDLDTENRKIKYFACGEYGTKSMRRHFHLIIFGMDYTEHDRQLIIDNWRFSDKQLFMSDKKGFCPVSPEDINYVCGYVQKKLFDKRKDYEKIGLVAPFNRSSQGIGLKYSQDNPDILSDRLINYKGGKVALPHYFVNKYDLPTPMKAQLSRVTHWKQYLESKGYDMNKTYTITQLEKMYNIELVNSGDALSMDILQNQTMIINQKGVKL